MFSRLGLGLMYAIQSDDDVIMTLNRQLLAKCHVNVLKGKEVMESRSQLAHTR